MWSKTLKKEKKNWILSQINTISGVWKDNPADKNSMIIEIAVRKFEVYLEKSNWPVEVEWKFFFFSLILRHSGK